jgi:hypothetical protein
MLVPVMLEMSEVNGLAGEGGILFCFRQEVEVLALPGRGARHLFQIQWIILKYISVVRPNQAWRRGFFLSGGKARLRTDTSSRDIQSGQKQVENCD